MDNALAPAQAQELERHLAECEECRQLAEDLRGFAGLGASAEPAWSLQEAEASLGRLRSRILVDEPGTSIEDPAFEEAGREREGGRESAAPPLPFKRPAASGPPPASRGPWALAAFLVIATGLVAWNRQNEVERLRSDLKAAGEAVTELRSRSVALANPLTIEAEPLDSPLRSAGGNTPLRGGVTVVVTGRRPFPPGKWRVEIASPDGKAELSLDGLRPVGGSLHLLLLPGALPRGEHHLRAFDDGEPWPQVFVLHVSDG